MSDTLTRLQNIIGEQLGIEPDQVTPEAHFENDLGADSLDVVELVMTIEDDFDIEINDDYASQIETVQHVLNYIEKLLEEG